MKIDYASGIYSLKVEQTLNASIDEAWDFFSTPKNLQEITPDDIGFKIQQLDGDEMYEGQIISYRIKLFPIYSTNWVTEIKHITPQVSFVDEQLFGPYKLWHHRHHFQEIDGKIIMTDHVHFKLPFGIIGRLFYPIIVKPKLKKIFRHRFEFVENKFNR